MSRSLAAALLLWTAVGIATATTSDSISINSISNTNNNRRQQQQPQPHRELASYSNGLVYGACFNVKEYDDENEDDDGNSYFYNGAYRAAYTKYASFFLCANGAGSRENGLSLLEDHDCAGPYVTELGTYMQVMAAFSSNYCAACKNCNNRRRRRLEEDENADEAVVVADCKTCKNECTAWWADSSYNEQDAEDAYECQASEQENEEYEYYRGPQCLSGEIVLGAFYDDECKFKSSQVYDSGSGTLQTIETMNVDCDTNADACDELAQMSFLCDNDSNNQEGGSSICKTAKTALRTRTYYKKPFYYKFPFGWVFLVGSVFGGLVFLSYTYFVRHSSLKRTPLADLDGKTGDADRSVSPAMARNPTSPVVGEPPKALPPIT